MSEKKLPGGVWPAFLSPFNEQGEPCEKTLDQLVELYISQGLGGFYVCGSTGMGPALNVAQRKQITERVIKTNANRLPVMVHVGATAIDEAVELAKHAADCGADAISSVPPIYYSVAARTMFDHYARIAGATDLPFVAYHARFMMSGVPGPAEYAQRLQEVPNFAGIKYTDQDMFYMEQLTSFFADDVIVFSGPDELMCHAILSGSHGAIGTFYNCFGPAFKKANEAFRAGNIQIAKDLHREFGLLIGRIKDQFEVNYPFMRQAMRIKYNIEIGKGTTVHHQYDDNVIAEAEVREWIERVDGAAGV